MTYRETEARPEPDRSILVVALAGVVAGLDRASGEVRWKNELRSGGLGEVFIAIGYGAIVASASGAKLFCLDYLTGETRWEAATSASGRTTIVMEPDRIICAKGGYLDCFDPHGERMWQQPLRGYGVGRIAMGFPGNVAQADDPGSE